jgi:hypothetical protein
LGAAERKARRRVSPASRGRWGDPTMKVSPLRVSPDGKEPTAYSERVPWGGRGGTRGNSSEPREGGWPEGVRGNTARGKPVRVRGSEGLERVGGGV